MDLAGGLERDGPVAVELELVFPALGVIREGVGPQQQHRIDEAGLRFGSHPGEFSLLQSKPQCLHSGYMKPIITRVSPCHGDVTGNRR